MPHNETPPNPAPQAQVTPPHIQADPGELPPNMIQYVIKFADPVTIPGGKATDTLYLGLPASMNVEAFVKAHHAGAKILSVKRQ